MHNHWLLYFGLFATLGQLSTGNKTKFLTFVWGITWGVTCKYSTSIWGCSGGKANTAGLVWANIYLHVEGMLFFQKNNAEIRMLCDDEIKIHNFWIDVDTALLFACSAFHTELNELAVVLRRKTSVGIADQIGAAAFCIPSILHELVFFILWLSVTTWIRIERHFPCYRIYSHGSFSLSKWLCCLVLSSCPLQVGFFRVASQSSLLPKKCQTKKRLKFVPVGLKETLSDLTQSTTDRKHYHLRKSKCFIIAARQMHLHKTPGSGPQTTDKTSLRVIFLKIGR